MARFSLSVGRMAGRLIIAGGVAALPGCLVLGEPEVEDPAPGRPQLLEISPPTGEMLLLRPAETGTFESLGFNARLSVPNDNRQVEVALLLNYGQSASDGSPWEEVAAATRPLLPYDNDEVAISLTWTPPIVDADTVVDCKSVTMVASHTFYGTTPHFYCPTQEIDEARLTWFVALCGASVPIDECSFDNCARPRAAQCPPPSELTGGGN